MGLILVASLIISHDEGEEGGKEEFGLSSASVYNIEGGDGDGAPSIVQHSLFIFCATLISLMSKLITPENV